MESKKPQNVSVPRTIPTQKTQAQPSVNKVQAPASKVSGAKVTPIPKPKTPSPIVKQVSAPAPKTAKEFKEQLKNAEQQAIGSSVKTTVVALATKGVVIQSWQIALAIVVILALVTGAVFLGATLANKNQEDPIIDYTGPLVNDNASNSGGITLPGYSAITCYNGQRKISIELPNPHGNPCYFRYTLTIVETGEEIYKSELLEPGKTLETLTLNQALAAGVYTLRIEIDTFSLADGTTPMNGGVQEVKLIVK